MSAPGLLAIFTEGDRARGLGHVTRCGAYAEAWRDRGGQVCWILDGDDAAADAIGAGYEIVLRRWQEEGGTTEPMRPVVALVDSYIASFATMETIAACAHVTVFIDDLGRRYPGGVVVHAAPDRTEAARSDDAEWLEGPSWQPLRRAFRDGPAREATRPEVERILIVFGGTDVRALGHATARLAARLYPKTSIDLVLGAGQTPPEPAPNLSVHRAIDDVAMASLMQAADVAISGAGQTVFELARCGTPAVLIGIADNQQVNLDHWPDLCGYVSAGRWDAPDLEARVRAGMAHLEDPARRADISRRAVAVVDGQGVRRLFDHLERSTVQETA